MRDFREYIVYEDKQLIVCHKPSGIPVQSAGIGVLDLECACLNYLSEKHKSRGRYPYVGIVQRLDQPVEGLLVLAKTQRSASELGKQVQDGRMEKIYLAVADGKVEPPEGMMQDWIIKDARNRMGKVVTQGVKGARKAKLQYRVLEYQSGKSLLEIHLHTGRYHQIRVQLSQRGFPLAGDQKYNPQGQQTAAGAGIGLCAYCLRFVHPISGDRMEWEILPEGEMFQGWHV